MLTEIPKMVETEAFPPLLARSLAFLNRVLRTATARRFVPGALHAGLLHVVASCGAANKFEQELRTLLGEVLPLSLLYYYNCSYLQDSLLHVRDLVQARAFRLSRIFDSWMSFSKFADKRLAILQSFDG